MSQPWVLQMTSHCAVSPIDQGKESFSILSVPLLPYSYYLILFLWLCFEQNFLQVVSILRVV